MGFFSGLEAEVYDRTYSDRDLLVRLASYFKPYKTRLLVAVIALAVLSAAGATSPILVSWGVDLLAGQSSTESMLRVSAALALLGLVVWATNWIRRRLTSRTIADVMLDLRRDAFAASARHDMVFYDEHSSARVVSRITSDTSEFSQVVVLATDMVSQFVQVAMLLVVLFSIEWKLTLWLTGIMPVFFLAAVGFRRLARRAMRRSMRAMGNVNAIIKEAVTGITIAKNFRQEESIYREFERVNRQSYGVNVRRGLVLASIFPTLNALLGIGAALLTYLGGLSAARGAIVIGAWYLFMRSLDRFWFPVLNLSAFWTQMQGGLAAAERVFALIDAESGVIQTDAKPLRSLSGGIEFDRLDFHYRPEEPVLRGFRLRIEPGENLALVGHTGAGKSSIVKLITRFYEFQGGRLLIDGVDIRELDLKLYRRQIGLVSQNPFLFSGTVLDNIRYANPGISASEVEALAGRIGEGEWLETLPEGLHTQVGERGSRLSMGQRQLVSLMRVLVQKPAIFILDEATANIDPFTESQIQQALSLILAETTAILIAHRLTTVRAADRIIVLREGEIIEEGDHRSLLARGGHYAELYNTYFRHQSLAYVESARQAALAQIRPTTS